MLKRIKDLIEDESGVTSVEYALLAAAAATVVGVAGTEFYERLQTAFENVSLSGTATSSGSSSTGSSGNTN
ncbi:MAG: Flp family type IVb pilin [Proteobacteria bacterium]|nr:Flp family type IVb pilin [Pseudomonadota bacterium]